MVVLDEDERYDEVRRIAGDRGGVMPPVLCKEFREVRLCRVGVVDRWMLPIELELGALRMGVLTERFLPGEGEEFSLLLEFVIRWATGEEGGRGVSIAVDKESCFMLFASVAPSIFVDGGMVLLSVGLSVGSGALLSISCIAAVSFAAAHSSSWTIYFFRIS